MNKYELIYIIDTAVEETARKELIEKFNGIIAANGGEVVKVEEWGKRRLAYAIDYKTEGYYVYVAFNGASELPKELSRNLGINENVIRSQIVKLLEKKSSVKPRTSSSLPRAEAVNIALHIVNAELEGSDLSSTLTAVEVLNEVTSAVEQELGITLDRESYNYARFAMHIQFLVRRLSAGAAMEQGSGKMLDELSREYPAVYHCACTVAQDIEQHHGWHCSRDEVLYLMLHIYRVQNRENG